MYQALTIIRRFRDAVRRTNRVVVAACVDGFNRIPAPVPVPVRAPRPRVALALALLSTVAITSAASAHLSPGRDEIDGNLVNVSVLVDGASQPLFVRPGVWDRTYFQAFQGRNYSLVVTNQTNERVGVLISVDGLNVVNGERTALSNSEPMYVLDPYETATIRGWRTSMNDIRRFVFVDEERSYASRTDQANGDMGWIRVLSFRERERRITWRERRPNINERDWGGLDDQRAPGPQGREDAPAPSPSGELRAQKPQMEGDRSNSNLAPPSQSAPGTGWGSHGYDPVQRTYFVPALTAGDQLVLRYEYADGLRALGIFPRQWRVWQRERGELGFAQPPRW